MCFPPRSLGSQEAAGAPGATGGSPTAATLWAAIEQGLLQLKMCATPYQQVHCSPDLKKAAHVPRKWSQIPVAWSVIVKSWKPPKCSSGALGGQTTARPGRETCTAAPGGTETHTGLHPKLENAEDGRQGAG